MTVRERLLELGLNPTDDGPEGAFVVGDDDLPGNLCVFQGAELDREIDPSREFTISGLTRVITDGQFTPCTMTVLPNGKFKAGVFNGL
jgi:hypothetical protein